MMKRAGLLFTSALILTVAVGMSSRSVHGGGAMREFEFVSVDFETNATDGDVEVVFKANGGDEGLRHLTVLGPNGKTAIDVDCPSPNDMGLRQFVLESPEPEDDGSLQAAYPEGTYSFAGTGMSGAQYKGSAKLSHKLPGKVRIENPRADAEGVATSNLQIRWTPVAGATGYMLELEQEESGISLTVNLPGTAKSFSVPEGFLQAGTEYMLGIGARASSGNATFVEIGFETAE